MNESIDKPPQPLPSGGAAAASDDQTVRRAEELVDRAGERMGHFASLVGRRLIRMAVRAREEAEDIWAEAQEIRRRGDRR